MSKAADRKALKATGAARIAVWEFLNDAERLSEGELSARERLVSRRLSRLSPYEFGYVVGMAVCMLATREDRDPANRVDVVTAIGDAWVLWTYDDNGR